MKDQHDRSQSIRGIGEHVAADTGDGPLIVSPAMVEIDTSNVADTLETWTMKGQSMR